MIRETKTGINEENRNDYKEDKHNYNSNQFYNVESQDAQVEELTQEPFNSNNRVSNEKVITKEKVLNAIQEQFNVNRNATKEMNNQIFNAFMEKVNNFSSYNSGDI